MKSTRLAAAGLLATLCNPAAYASPGLPTRDLNPVLQQLYLPGMLPMRDDDGWQLQQGFVVTNTAQEYSKSGETAIIDAENYRYEIALGLRRDAWIVQASLPFIANRGGFLDSVIEDWHDLWGFPNGDRGKLGDDHVQIEYSRDGRVYFSETASTGGIGDLALALGYQPAGGTGYYFGIELPSGSEAEFSGNGAVDLALWLSWQVSLGEPGSAYGMLGVSVPGKSGPLEDLVVERIWLAQFGLEHRFSDGVVGILQVDFHSKTFDESRLAPYGDSLQLQVGLGLPRLIENHRLDLFFSEDILVGSAPDISFGLRLVQPF